MSGGPLVSHRPVLVLACGNPSRGDDALGPELVARLQRDQLLGTLTQVELLTDFQLQVEHALDLRQRRAVLFADASLTARPPFELGRVGPSPNPTYTTHALSPGAVLHAFRMIEGRPPPPAWLISIRGYRFALGAGMSRTAKANLDQALDRLKKLLERDPAEWGRLMPERQTVATDLG